MEGFQGFFPDPFLFLPLSLISFQTILYYVEVRSINRLLVCFYGAVMVCRQA